MANDNYTFKRPMGDWINYNGRRKHWYGNFTL